MVDGVSVRLHHGRWQDTLAHIETCDVICTDPPYSAKTCTGFKNGNLEDGVGYGALTRSDALSFASHWHSRVQDWVLIFCDHIAFRWWEEAWGKGAGWYTFAPVYWVKSGGPPRMTGDGPTSSVEMIFIARPKGWPKHRGSRPGHYMASRTPRRAKGAPRVVGRKDIGALCELLEDYTSPGDLVVDPYAGTATVAEAMLPGVLTLVDLSYEGSEVDAEVWAHAVERLGLSEPMRAVSVAIP